MPIESVTPDLESLTLTAVGVFPVPVERLWRAFADPRQLERFWGPPDWPATFTRHDMSVGGRSEYYMSGPDGEKAGGFWRFLEVEEHVRFVVEDGFLDDNGAEVPGMPLTRMELVFEATPTGSRFVSTSTFPSLEAMEQLVAMGMVEGLTAAMSQMDDVLADLRDHSRSLAAELELVGDTQAGITRVVRGSLQQVWRAHTEPELVRQWMLGPDGWEMVDCVIGTSPGEPNKMSWQRVGGGDFFGFEGVAKEVEPPRRIVFTEAMQGMEAPPTMNETVFTPVPGGRTRISVTITYASPEMREMVLGTGMVDGMEASYARLDTLLAE